MKPANTTPTIRILALHVEVDGGNATEILIKDRVRIPAEQLHQLLGAAKSVTVRVTHRQAEELLGESDPVRQRESV